MIKESNIKQNNQSTKSVKIEKIQESINKGAKTSTLSSPQNQ